VGPLLYPAEKAGLRFNHSHITMPTTEDHNEKEGVRVYEIGYLVLPSVPEENLSKVVSHIDSLIEKAGGTKLDSEDPQMEELAYSMSKTISARKYVVNEAYIGWMKFEAESKAIEAIKTGVDKIEEVLRHLLIKVPRETTFTFEAARKARAEREDALRAESAPEVQDDAEVKPEEKEVEPEAPAAVV
jgi:ribosomal protein S6